LNSNIILIVTKVGGHVGWFEGHIFPKRWYMKPSLEFIDFFENKRNKMNDESLINKKLFNI